MLGGTRAFEAALDGVPSDGWPWVQLLTAFAVLAVAAGVVAFGPLLEEAREAAVPRGDTRGPRGHGRDGAVDHAAGARPRASTRSGCSTSTCRARGSHTSRSASPRWRRRCGCSRVLAAHVGSARGCEAEVGVVFTALMLIVGSLWGRPTWGTWWEWDARLTTTAIMFFLYLGYLALRRTAATAEERGKRCAIAALIAFADVPIVHFSVTWWQTLHQTGTVFNPELDVKIDGSMAFTLVLAVGAFTMLYGYLVLERFQLAELEEGLEDRELERAIAERVRADQMVTLS